MFTDFVQLVQNYKTIKPNNFINRFKKKRAYKKLKELADITANSAPMNNATIEDFLIAYKSTEWIVTFSEITEVRPYSFDNTYNHLTFIIDERKFDISCRDTYFNVCFSKASNNKIEYSHFSESDKMYENTTQDDQEVLALVEHILRSIFQDYLHKLLEFKEEK